MSRKHEKVYRLMSKMDRFLRMQQQALEDFRAHASNRKLALQELSTIVKSWDHIPENLKLTLRAHMERHQRWSESFLQAFVENERSGEEADGRIRHPSTLR